MNIVIVTSGLVGILNSGLEIARRLRNDGHDVVFVGWRDIAPQVEAHSFAYVRLIGDEEAQDRYRSASEGVGRLRSLRAGRRSRREMIEATEIEDAIETLRPDLLIIDVEVHTAVVAASSIGVPFVLRFDLLSVYRSWSVPPLHIGLAAPTTVAERIRCVWSWVELIGRRYVANSVGELRPGRIGRRFRPFGYGTVSRADVAAFARHRDVRLRQISSRSHWLRPHVYPHAPLMSTTLAELELPHANIGDVHHVGPMIAAETVDARVSPQALARWEAFRDEHVGTGSDLIYCGLGTLDPTVVRRVRHVVDAVADRPDRPLVIGLGGQATAAELGVVPEHVLVLDYAPQPAILAFADAAVVHGGINSINECIAMSVPMVLPYTGVVDQPGNAVRVEHHGLGVRVDLDGDRADVAAGLDQVLGDPSYRRRAADMAATAERYGRTMNDLVERWGREISELGALAGPGERRSVEAAGSSDTRSG